MTKFIFLRGYVGTLNVMDGETYATASFHEQTPEGVMGRRRLYHTDLSEYERQREWYQRLRGDDVISQQQYNLNRDMLATQERVRRRLIDTDNQIRLFQATTVTTVNPNWRTRIKMGLQELSIFFKSSPYGIMFIWASSTIVAILILSKILSIW
jgi:hypothetical protein